MSTTANIERAKTLSKRLSGVDKNLDKIIREIATTQNTSNIYWNKIKISISKEYEKARKISAVWTDINIPIVYRDEIKNQLTRIKNKNIEGLRNIPFSKFANTDLAKQSTASLINSTISTLATGFDSGQKTMIGLSRLTQQILISEKQINRNIASGFIEKGTINESIKRTQNELLKKSLDGKYITVIDKNGKPTQWQVSTYSELVARTKLQETSTQAVVNSTMAVGGDLVQVSSHNTRTPFDAQFEGKIYSLSGNDPDFPQATILPPYHPNCLHSITSVFRSGLSAAGILGKSIDFAQGKTEVHPTRRSHIAVSKRVA